MDTPANNSPAVSSEPEEGAAPAGARPPAPAAAAPGEVAKGAQPTNRAPYNCMGVEFRSLRYGIDSLYLSYVGKLAPEWDERLRELKAKAQAEDKTEQAEAQVKIGAHLFEVTGTAPRPFAFVLADNCFFIAVSSAGKSGTVPLAHVQISSEYLSAVGVETAETDLRFVVNTLGLVESPAKVSRADLFVDLVCGVDLNQFDESDWIYRAHVFSKYWYRRRFSGFNVGRGGDLMARLYDKTLEVEVKSHKFYLHDLWRQAGWDEKATVWRPEFQLRRNALKDFQVDTVAQLLGALPGLWDYLTGDWLRLVTPNPQDKTQS